MVARHFYKAVRFLFFRARIRGRINLRFEDPVIMVANHVGSFGPVSLITSLPLRIFPWVAHEVTDVGMVAPRIQREFLEQELHLRPPLSRWLGRVVGRICVAIMRDIGAVPVYQKSKKITETVMQSLSLLEQGKSLLVFAEDSTRRVNDTMCEFCTGFIHVARLYYQRTRKAVQFLPVAINRRIGAILVGAPIRFDALKPFSAEKKRLKAELERTICSMYEQLERSGLPAAAPMRAAQT
ncbi:MAG: lysophospholipid acyltransferase family protein [Spirochaetia bacterium]